MLKKLIIHTLSPIHIGSGDDYEYGFNMLHNDSFLYIYDEFKIAQFFITNNMELPLNLELLKEKIETNKNKIITLGIEQRKIKSSFGVLSKPLLENISSQSKPIITGSSIKGAIRTAYIFAQNENGVYRRDQEALENIEDRINICNDFKDKKDLLRDKKNILSDINRKITSNTKSDFKYLKISDSYKQLETEVWKSINIKKEKSHQTSRQSKVENIANFIECIPPNNSFEVDIKIENEKFSKIEDTCNKYYNYLYEKEFENFFTDKTMFKKVNLKENQFLLNIGRFSGAELKSIDEIRSLPKTGAETSWETSARTYGTNSTPRDTKYFENSLIPFGWILCEIVEQ